MKLSSIVLASAVAACGCEGADAASLDDNLEVRGGGGQPDAPLLGLHLARGGGGGQHGPSPDLIYHGGIILTSSEVTAIFWGARWADAQFVGDKLTGLDTFYSGVGGSTYMGTNTEYTGSNGQVGN